jgi:hypothetical protein
MASRAGWEVLTKLRLLLELGEGHYAALAKPGRTAKLEAEAARLGR